MNNLGRRLADRECSEYQRVVTEPCNNQPCPKWTVSEWSEVGTFWLHCHFILTCTHFTHTLFFFCPHSVPGDLWEGDEAQTGVLQLRGPRRKAERSLLRPVRQTFRGGELRAARVRVLAGRRMGSGESQTHARTHTHSDTSQRGVSDVDFDCSRV